MPIPSAKGEAEGGASFEDELSRQIAAAEASSAWTLMHRFKKAADLLSQLKDVSSKRCPCAYSVGSRACVAPMHLQAGSRSPRYQHLQQPKVWAVSAGRLGPRCQILHSGRDTGQAELGHSRYSGLMHMCSLRSMTLLSLQRPNAAAMKLYWLRSWSQTRSTLCMPMQGAFDDTADAAARIFVWLRYSSSRKLTWQRNYNTQPRILGEAQARLTQVISEVSSPCGTSMMQDILQGLACS